MISKLCLKQYRQIKSERKWKKKIIWAYIGHIKWSKLWFQYTRSFTNIASTSYPALCASCRTKSGHVVTYVTIFAISTLLLTLRSKVVFCASFCNIQVNDSIFKVFIEIKTCIKVESIYSGTFFLYPNVFIYFYVQRISLK